MKTVTGTVVSSKPISLSKAASTLSSFLSADNGASQALCAYLRRASASFNELKQLHKDLKSSRSDREHRHPRTDVPNELEAAVDSSYRIEDGVKIKSPVSVRKSGKKRRENRDRTEDGKTALASGGNGNFEDVVGEDGKIKSGELKTEVESSFRDKRVVAIEKKKKKHKKKSEDGDERDVEARKSDGKSQISANNGEIEDIGHLVENSVAREKDRKKHGDKKSLGDDKVNDDGKDVVEMSTKKKKKKKREEDVDVLLNNSGGALEKEETLVSDSKQLKRKEKKRKNRAVEEEGGDDGSEEQLGTKRRKGNF